MTNHWLHAGVKATRLLLVAACCLIASPASAQTSRSVQGRLLADKSISLSRSLHPRAQHALAVLVSEKRLQEVTQLDRAAALSTGKFARRLQSIAQSLSSVTATPVSASELTELGAAAGAAERKLFLALKEKRAQYNQAFKSPGSISLIQPLNLATIEAARLVRLRLGSLATEIPDLDQAAVCRGDIVMDRMLYRYGRAVTAEDDAETTSALRDIQIQLACMSTRQIRAFELALIESVERADGLVAPPSGDAVRKLAVRNSFRQLFAPIVFATADASRLFSGYERPAIKWLSKHKDMLTAAALRKSTITNRVGLLFANRFTGQLERVVGDCAKDTKKIFADGRGGRTCNPLGALFQSVGLPCDPIQWVPENSDRATKFVCDDACIGAPGSVSEPLSTPEGGGKCSFPGPSGGGSGARPDLPGGVPGGAGTGGQGCNGVDPMFGDIGFQSPFKAYTEAYNACLQSMANRSREGEQALGMEMTGFAPGGNVNCMLADATAEEAPTPEPDSADERTEDEKNLAAVKEAVKSVIDGFVAYLKALSNINISAKEVQLAKTSIDNAEFGPCDKCRGRTSPTGKITIEYNTCSHIEQCFATMLHEGLHAAMFYGEEREHEIMGDNSEQTYWLYLLYASQTPKSCLPDEPSCTRGCTSREAAASDCMRAALSAYSQRLREMNQKALDCATDACWNPATDDGTRGERCGSPDTCRGQSVALCTPEQPNCMCGNAGATFGPKDALRNLMWRDYCARAQDERCSSPTVPTDFGASGPPPPSGSLVPSAGTLTSRENLVLGGGRVVIYADGTVRLKGSVALRPGAADPDCTSNSCRASQRGDW